MKPRLCDRPGELLRPLTRSCFFLFLGRLSLLALPHLLGTCLPSLWSSLLPLHAPALIPLSRQMGLSLTLTFSHLMIWCFGHTALFLCLLAKAALHLPFSSISLAYLAETVFSFLLFYQDTMGLPDTPFSGGTTRLMSWPEQGALLVPSAIPYSLSLISRIHSCLFSGWRRTVSYNLISSKFFNTQVASISTEELVLPRHARCVLSRLRCSGHNLLLSF